jgi:DNA repair ATPase RecN
MASTGGDARGIPPQDAKDLATSASQLAADTQQIQQALKQAGIDPKDLQSLDDIQRMLKQLGNQQSYGDPKSLQQLQQTAQTALDKLQKFDLDMRKRFDRSNGQLYLNGSETVPPQYQSLVNDYMKALSNAKKKGGGN